MRFPDVIIAGDGTLLVPAITSAGTILGPFGVPIPAWQIDAAGGAAFDTAQINEITGGYGGSAAEGSKVWLSPQSTFGINPKVITEGVDDSGGAGFRVLRVPNIFVP